METIKEIYRIGFGPSSSHTMGPRFAAEQFIKENPLSFSIRVTLYGSLAATGKGHLTDVAITKALMPKKVQFIWKPEKFFKKHPNAMLFEALDENENVIAKWTAYSVGGGKIIDDNSLAETTNIYKHQKFNTILKYCETEGIHLWEYVAMHETEDIWLYLEEVWDTMKNAIKRGIASQGVLPGGLKLPRKAATYYIRANGFKASLKRKALVFAYALAVAEENADGGKIVTAPTCGSCGVLPAVLFLLHEFHDFDDDKIVKALATAGLIGNLIKKNASISGAEVGCQGEIGTACAMAAGAASQLFGGTPAQIEYAAEMGLEHHLGLTCDPVCGLVQIPCIERNAFAASRALDANLYSIMSDGKHRISFDRVVETMEKTGHDLPSLYRETAEGGLAKMAWQ